MKYIVLGDTHLGIYKSSDVWHEVVLNLFKEIHDICIKRDIKHIIHLGDFFHDRKSINVKTQEYAHRIMDIINGDFHMWICAGNHDIFYKNRIHPTSLNIFRKYNYIEVIDEVKTKGDITLSPWGSDISLCEGGFLFGHFEITGFNMNNTSICKVGNNPNDFSGFEKVFSGHFHTPSSNKNITYIGAPYQQTFHDLDGIRGFYIFDDTNGEMEFIEFNDYPKFIIHKTSEDIEKEKINGNIVKVIFEEDYGTKKNTEIIDSIMLCEPLQLNTNFAKMSNAESDEYEEEDVDIVVSHSDIIKNTIDMLKIPKNIKKDTVLSMIDKLMKEIK